MKHVLRPMLAALLFLTAADAAARWYHVEVIVFRYTEPRYADGEQWVVPALLPDYASATRLTRKSANAEPSGPSDSNLPVAFRPVASGALQMRNIAGALRRDPGTEVLLHTAWRQPSYGNVGARSVYLDDLPLPDPDAAPGIEGADMAFPAMQAPAARGPEGDLAGPEALLAPEPRFRGALRLRTGRQLHLDADFVLEYEEAPVRLVEARRVLFRETHYFDHPLFGVLVRVLPYHLPGADIADEPEDEGEPDAPAPDDASEAQQGSLQ